MTQRERQVLQLIEADPLISQQDIAAKLGITRSSVAVHIANLTKKGCIAGRGYVLHAGTYAVVVGGVNVDIGGGRIGPPGGSRSHPRRGSSVPLVVRITRKPASPAICKNRSS